MSDEINWHKIALKMRGLVEGYIERGNQDRLTRALYIARCAEQGEEADGKAWPEEALDKCFHEESCCELGTNDQK